MTDLRIAFRFLAKAPWVTVPVVLVLGLGIGATTAVFSVVDHVLFRPLPLPESERLVTICESHADRADYCTASTPNVEDWSALARSFDAIGAGRDWPFAVRTADGAHQIAGGYATGRFFAALGVTPSLGRLIGPGDVPPRADGAVAVISDEYWRTQMGGVASVLGRTIVLDEKAYAVIGVLPPRFRVPRVGDVAIWLPLAWDPRDESRRDWRGFVAAGRLSNGASLASAEQELRSIYATLTQLHPDALRGWRIDVLSMQDRVVGSLRPVLLTFLGAVGLVLLLVCVNVAALLLARATSREREMAVRFALGAHARHVVRQLLVESAVLTSFGGLAGVLIAIWAVDALVALAPPGTPRLDEVAVDHRVLAFVVVLTSACAVLFALVPFWRTRGVDATEVFRGGRSTSGSRWAARLRHVMVVAEVAVALVLLASAGLLLRSFVGLLEWHPGFDTERVLTFSTFLSQGKFPNRDALLRVYRDGETQLATLPGVVSVSTASAGPLFGGGDGAVQFLVNGRAAQSRETAPWANWFDVGPGYFKTLGVPLLRGRAFTEADDRGGALVVLVNNTMAKRFWPDGNPVGSRLRLLEFDDEVEVIGVVGDVPPFHPGDPVSPELYFTNRQMTRWATFFIVRTSGNPGALGNAIKDRLSQIDRDFVPAQMRTLSQSMSRELVRPRFHVTVVGFFALVALVLALVGVYGVIAYTVEMRTQEFGIRLALGATPAQIVRGTLGPLRAWFAIGIVVGLGASVVFGRLLATMLYGVSPLDPATLVAVTATIAVSALCAALGPAVRAAGTDPASSLRIE